MPVRPEFTVHLLNEHGIIKAGEIALSFSNCLTEVEQIIGDMTPKPIPTGTSGVHTPFMAPLPQTGARELALVRTDLQSAAFWAKRALALRPEHQLGGPPTPAPAPVPSGRVRYRKKPVVIDAIQYIAVPGATTFGQSDTGGGNMRAVMEFCAKDVRPLGARENPGVALVGDQLKIPTLEGDHMASHLDWIIRGIKGELYPCKPDIFAATYDQVEE